VAGHDIKTDPEAIKGAICYMSQKFSLYEDLTPFENLRFYLGVYAVPEALWEERIQWIVGMTRLEEAKDRRTRELPPGLRQRLALGCALLHKPDILFLDEPTSGVDPVTRQAFWEFIVKLAGGGVTIFVTTHYMDEAEQCHRLAFIHDGKLVATGTPTSIKQNHMNGYVIEIDCDQPPQALQALREIDQLEEVALYGRLIHVVVSDVAAQQPQIAAKLESAKISVNSIIAIPPSLEDVFISSAKRDDAGTM
jgi:ABC-2 type transport system ATP-binding protein